MPSLSRLVGRRRFLQAAGVAGVAPMLEGKGAGSRLTPRADQAAGAVAATGADVGSLFPFIQSQAVKGDFPLSFLNPRFTTLNAWTPLARAKVLDLPHYTPPPCSPAAETVERVDCGDYVRE
jgi:hypothetical protein